MINNLITKLLRRRWFVAWGWNCKPKACQYATGLWGLLGPWSMFNLIGPCSTRQEAIAVVKILNKELL